MRGQQYGVIRCGNLVSGTVSDDLSVRSGTVITVVWVDGVWDDAVEPAALWDGGVWA